MDGQKRQVILADAGLVISAVLWGGDYVVLKIALEGLNPLFINAVRFGLATLLLLAAFRKHLRRITLPVVGAGFVVGFLMFAAFATQTLGLTYTTAGKSAFLTSQYVIFIPLVSWLLFRRFPGIPVFISSGICVVGLAFLSLEGSDWGSLVFAFGPGEALTLACALFFGVNITAVEYYVRRVDPILLTLTETAFGALFFCLSALIFEPAPSALTGVSLGALAYLATLGTALTHVLANLSLKFTPATHASVIFTLETVFALVFGSLFLREIITGPMIAGFALILAALFITEAGSVRAGRPGHQKL